MIGGTIIPRGGQDKWNRWMDQVRLQVNDWIRHGGYFDGVIDFDAMLQGVPRSDGVMQLREGYHCYDGVHPNSVGYAYIASQIDLNLFKAH